MKARLTDHYTFTDTGRTVDNADHVDVPSSRTGLILHHNDDCDPVAWANMAMTGPKAWLAGHARPVLALAANKKLQEYLHTELENRSRLNAVDTESAVHTAARRRSGTCVSERPVSDSQSLCFIVLCR